MDKRTLYIYTKVIFGMAEYSYPPEHDSFSFYKTIYHCENRDISNARDRLGYSNVQYTATWGTQTRKLLLESGIIAGRTFQL